MKILNKIFLASLFLGLIIGLFIASKWTLLIWPIVFIISNSIIYAITGNSIIKELKNN